MIFLLFYEEMTSQASQCYGLILNCKQSLGLPTQDINAKLKKIYQLSSCFQKGGYKVINVYMDYMFILSQALLAIYVN